MSCVYLLLSKQNKQIYLGSTNHPIKSIEFYKKMKSGAGFTLTELLVVIGIIGLLTTIVMVNFKRGNYTNDLRQAGTELLQNVRLAQQYTIGGSSLNYCGETATNQQYYPCNDDFYCGNINGSCVNGVPKGGYGLNVVSQENYQIFGDTNSSGTLDLSDYTVISKDISLKGLHIRQFKLSDQPAAAPDVDNYIVVRFSPPEGTVHFYLNGSELPDTTTTLELLVGSDYLSGSCRRIIINRISGQISEGQSGCSL